MKNKSIDKTTESLLNKAQEDGVETAWDRLAAQLPQCGFGELGICCKNCAMGPCRIDPFGEGAEKGVCGATAETIAARNFLRMIAAGAASHSDHGRGVAELFLAVAKNEASGYQIKDEKKLLQLAGDFGIKTEGKKKEEIAREVGEIALAQFGQQEAGVQAVA